MITGHTIVEEGLRNFPELRTSYERYCADWHGEFPGNYTVFSDVFRPLFADAIQADDRETLRRFAKFFEDVIESGDDEAANIVWLRLFKWLLGRESEFALFWEYCNPNVRRFVKKWAPSLNLSPSTWNRVFLC